MSPTRKSALDVRARAIAISASEASSPATVAPRPAATLAAYPEPQAMSSSRVPGPTPARSNSASLARRAYGSNRYAQSAARSPQACPDSAHPIGPASPPGPAPATLEQCAGCPLPAPARRACGAAPWRAGRPDGALSRP
jgi:hypothetical protein